MENCMKVSQKIELPYDPVIPFLGICEKKKNENTNSENTNSERKH